MYKISVIITVFNKRETLARAVGSVLGQDVKGIEVIVVDDGSTDDSIDSLAPELKERVRIIIQTNQGVSVARNMGVANSNAPLIAFLDADDEYAPGALSLFLRLSESFPQAIFFSGAYDIVSENGVVYTPAGSWQSDKTAIIKEFAREWRHNGSLISSSSVCIRRKAFLDSGGFPDGAVRGEDVYLWLRLSINGHLCHSGQRVSRVYRNAPNRTIQTAKFSSQVHYFLTYFIKDEFGYVLYSQDIELRKLLFALAIKNLFGAKEARNMSLVAGIVDIYRKHSVWRYYILWLASLFPIPLIKLLRSIRVACGHFSIF